MLRFPFWLLTPNPADDAALSAISGKWPMTFSSEEKMNDFLAEQQNIGHWEVRLVNRYSVRAVIADLERQGYFGVCQDAKPDGSGGNVVLLADITAGTGSVGN